MKTISRLDSRSTSAAGFTRVEALTLALGTLACASLQFPLLGNATLHSRTAVCLDNLHRLALAHQMYATDGDGWFPPNPDDGSSTPGRNWVPGVVGPGGPMSFDPTLLADSSRSLLFPYLQSDVSVFRCPADPLEGRRRGATSPLALDIIPEVRSVALNAAVGTNPDRQNAKISVDAPWLDNQHGHLYGARWFTYGRESQLVTPGPSLTSFFIDEDEWSINDGTLAFGMASPEWIDWPSTRHDNAGTLSFGDGHVEIHRWVDPRTRVLDKRVVRTAVPGSVDYFWLRDRTSAAIPK